MFSNFIYTLADSSEVNNKIYDKTNTRALLVIGIDLYRICSKISG
jgi:hypothetical protein